MASGPGSPSADDLLADLTDDQRAAVTHAEGPLLILAGAGSGKTRVITRRVAYLLRQGIRPGSILAITFTNKAAGEMRGRVEQLVPGNRVWVSTFHSLGARLLRQYADRLGIDKNFTIYDIDDRNKLVKDALAATGIDDVKFSPERLAGAISKAKNQLLTPNQYERTANDFFSQTVAKVYHGYEKRLRAANAMDFDDLLYLPAMALKANEEFRRDLDARFRYVLIDEYQDTNLAQYEIAKRLSLNHPNLCVVGDPDQCVPAGTLIQTPHGPRPVETVREGDEVQTCAGSGKVIRQRVSAVMVNPHRGNLVKVTLANGMELLATSNHVCFARVGDKTKQQRMASALFINSKQESSAAAFHGWERDPLPDAQSYAAGLIDRPEFEASPTLKLLRSEAFRCIRAGNLRPGLLVPVYLDGKLVEAEIASIELELYEGQVYDLTVPETHNFVANGLVVHNSIYKWRGSDIKNILDFERDFPDARVITLSKNYRSTKSILAAASTLIDHNKQRKKKTLVTDNPAGVPVRVITFDNGLDEAEGVVVRIKEAVTAGRFRYRDHAIFMRINALTRSLESAFVKHGVPFQIVKGLAFFERKENRDVLAYLRLLVNPQDAVSFLRIVNEPGRGIGKASLDKLQSYAGKLEMSLFAAAGEVAKIPEIKGKAATGLRDFYRLITELRTQLELPPHDLIRLVLQKSGYSKMLETSDDTEDADRLANVEELVTAAKQFHDEDPSRTITDFLEQITLASDVDGWDEQSDAVSVMTLHASKGLEFPVVYVLAVEEGLLPHQRSVGHDEEVEEERRLCFVGMTRAMKELNLCHARLREFRGQLNYAIPSSFLGELPRDVEQIDVSHAKNYARSAADEWRAKVGPAARDWADTGARPFIPPKKPAALTGGGSDTPTAELAAGVLVQHEEYGLGQVTDVTGFGSLRRVKIRFPGSGEKTFVADKVKLKVVGRKKG
jgi:superfamily I DNA/RNA helicase